MKFLVAPLCSDLTKPEEVVRCINSVRDQEEHPFDWDIKVVANTNDDEYAESIRTAVGDVEVVQTESNGGNGMGHNSVLQLFRDRYREEGYTHLIMIDADDALYPCAFEVIDNLLILDPGIDYCGVGSNADSVRRGTHPQPGRSIELVPGIHLHSNFNYRYPIPMNPIYAGIENGCPGGEVTLFVSANAVERDLYHLEWPMIPDDFTHLLWAMKHHLLGNLRYVSTDTTDVYLYDKTNSVGTTNQPEFKFDPRQWPAAAVEYVRTNFSDIVGVTRGHFPFLTLPPVMFPGEKVDWARDQLLFFDE